ncbi:DUF4062 domain-containing protein [Candidatus Kuenenia stuttgartensis]|uniref:DUF4062 domain-containing protein n=1 Tax=Kuenenia stuttgartiensis TaxID=174633 RepID=Q1Q5A9_KUEST|nr:DUF4062 domain-containing protein [Candidatus Kuenenia stuttgartiensis]CAJ75194.1 conserved hypothetical protein [Candidatus Kuenenia stuttgartiensis]
MSYESKVFNVMIASPGDVASERNIIREMLYEWNAVHSRSRKIVLLPVGWESHSSPEMGKRPQEIINNLILDKCDLLVGVFWTRIGTSTEKYISGTVEEIEKHIAADKPTMLYFSGQPARLDSVDSEQYEKLKEFKASCKDRGLYETYDSHSEFKEKFYHHLQIKVNEHVFFFSENEEPFQEVIYASKTQIPQIGGEARILLKEASQDNHGTILYVRTFGGTDIQTNGKNLIPEQNARVVAQWASALNELLNTDLIVERGHKGEVFQVTSLGYQVADMIEI